jgi:hypothetical protein
MRYVVEIIPVDPPETGRPVYRLPGEHGSLDDANAAAQRHIVDLGREPGGVHYRVLDQNGREVVTTHDPQA